MTAGDYARVVVIRPPRGSRPRQGRAEDYAELRSFGLSRSQAAARIGVSVRTTQRYERSFRLASGCEATS